MNRKGTLTVACALLLLVGGALGARASAASSHIAVFEGDGKLSDSGKLSFSGRVGGELNGYLTVTINYNRETNAVESGEWTISVLDNSSDNNRGETGKLRGSVSGGSVKLGAGGALASVEGVELKVTEGTGDYATTTSGVGSFSAGAGGVGAPPFVGDVQLNF
jgi:hypothetical protein